MEKVPGKNSKAKIDRLIRDNLKAIGARAKQVRRKLELNQKTISEKLNVVTSYLSDK